MPLMHVWHYIFMQGDASAINCNNSCLLHRKINNLPSDRTSVPSKAEPLLRVQISPALEIICA